MNGNRDICNRDRWARFRFSVIGPLLSAPPEKGELRGELARLAAKLYKHPITDSGLRLGVSTIERWYYAARDAADPLETLKSRLRKDRGAHPSLPLAVRALILTQHQAHPGWSYRLHYAQPARADREQTGSVRPSCLLRGGASLDERPGAVSAQTKEDALHRWSS